MLFLGHRQISMNDIFVKMVNKSDGVFSIKSLQLKDGAYFRRKLCHRGPKYALETYCKELRNRYMHYPAGFICSKLGIETINN